MSGKNQGKQKNVSQAVRFDAVELEVLWNRLITVVDEAAYAILRTSMSKVVVEGHDFGVLLTNAQGELLASDVSVAIKASATATAVKEILKRFPISEWQKGDVIASNNPWWNLGHLNDVLLVAPIFHGGRIVGFSECMAHLADIGGCLSANPRELYEEGLIIPPIKVVEGGRENLTFFSMLKANVRVPGQVVGDVHGLIAGCNVMEAKVSDFLREEGLEDLEAIGRAILERSEAAMRQSIVRTIPNGVYQGQCSTDGFDEPINIAVRVEARDGQLDIDFSGTSPQSGLGINSTLAYTSFWTNYVIKCLVNPRLPSNEGVSRPVRISAPEGSLVNPIFPAPVKMKPVTGHYIPTAIMEALKNAIESPMLAESGNKIVLYLSGRDAADRPFSDLTFVMGGMGARSTKDGLHCRSFPANSSTVPVEVLESTIPLLVRSKRILTDSGGPGRYRGGCGQEFEFESLSPKPIHIHPDHGKLCTAPKGLRGGRSGSAGGLWLNEEPFPDKSSVMLKMGDVVRMQAPGSGGMYSPKERDPEAVRLDVLNEIVSVEMAKFEYGVEMAFNPELCAEDFDADQ